MSIDHIQKAKDFEKRSGELMKACPDVMRAFFKLHGDATAEGALSYKTKELIGIGISIAVKCEDCIDGHVKAALDAGATAEEISEAVGVAVMMGGGPSTTYGAYTIEAMNQFLAE